MKGVGDLLCGRLKGGVRLILGCSEKELVWNESNVGFSTEFEARLFPSFLPRPREPAKLRLTMEKG